MTAKGVKKPDCDSQQKKKDIWRSMTSSNKDAQYNSLQNAVRPPISAAVAFLPETMHSDNPFADLQWQLGYSLTPNSTVTIQGGKKKPHTKIRSHKRCLRERFKDGIIDSCEEAKILTKNLASRVLQLYLRALLQQLNNKQETWAKISYILSKNVTWLESKTKPLA